MRLFSGLRIWRFTSGAVVVLLLMCLAAGAGVAQNLQDAAAQASQAVQDALTDGSDDEGASGGDAAQDEGESAGAEGDAEGEGEGDGDEVEGGEGESQEVVAEGYGSPAAVLRTFMESMAVVGEEPENEGAWRLVYDALDMGASAGSSRRDVAWKLLAILEALGDLDPAAMAPDAETVREQELERFDLLKPAGGSEAAAAIEEATSGLEGESPAPIELVRGGDGMWRFGSETIGSINELVRWLEPQIDGEGLSALSQTRSGWLRDWIPASLRGRFVLGQELWQWAGLGVLIFVVVVIDFILRLPLRWLLRLITKRLIAKPDDDVLAAAARPSALTVATVVFLGLLPFLGLTGMALETMGIAGRLVFVAAATWAMWAIADLLSNAWRARTSRTLNTLDDMIVPLVRKTVKLFVIAWGVVFIAETLDVIKYFAPLIAGIGVAGLAISFAAQDMVKNLFGGITIFLDRPFKIGERIVYKGFDGVVEEIGFRSTRVRMLSGHLVTIPNGNITNDPVENIGRRPFIRRIMNVTITYDTPLEKVHEAVEILRGILEEDGIGDPIHPKIGMDEYPPRVYFNEYNDMSLNIMAIYWYAPPQYWDYLEHAEKVNLRLREEYEKAGIEFAYPTQTLYLAGDPERRLAVEVMKGGAGGGGEERSDRASDDDGNEAAEVTEVMDHDHHDHGDNKADKADKAGAHGAEGVEEDGDGDDGHADAEGEGEDK